MPQLFSIDVVSAYFIKAPAPFDRVFSLSVMGEAPTSGWMDVRIEPRFYIQPPSDGVWDLDFLGTEPTGIAAQVVTFVGCHALFKAPLWCTGVRVHSTTNSLESSLDTHSSKEMQTTAWSGQHRMLTTAHVIFKKGLASFDDSFQPTGATKYDPWPHAQMKKLHHDLVLTVEGPDEQKIKDCVTQALAAGVFAAIIAACATGGAALPAAVSAFIAYLENCLGNSFQVRIDDNSHWETWWT